MTQLPVDFWFRQHTNKRLRARMGILPPPPPMIRRIAWVLRKLRLKAPAPLERYFERRGFYLNENGWPENVERRSWPYCDEDDA